MKRLPFIILALLCVACHKTMSVEDYRKVSAAADAEVQRLQAQYDSIEQLSWEYDTLPETPKTQAIVARCDKQLDSLHALIQEQCSIMNTANKECDSIHHTPAL